MKKPKKLSEVLTGPERWVKRKGYVMAGGEYTAMCLGTAYGQLGEAWRFSGVLSRVIHDLFPLRACGGSVIAFNDHPNTTWDDVALGSVIAFNDHPNTTWDDVALVIEEFDRRMLKEVS